MPLGGELIGIAVGAVARRDRFCTLAALERHWYAGDSSLDDEIRSRFGNTLRAAETGDLEDWKQTIEGQLASGRDAIDLLKDAGVDMTTDEPLELTMQKMNRVIAEMERLLDAIESR